MRFDERAFVSVTAFESIFDNLADPLGTEHHLTFDAAETGRRVHGAAWGLEVYVKRPMANGWGGFVSYTLSRSVRSYGTIQSLSSLDRTHVVTAAGLLGLGRRWFAGARATLESGLPIRVATTAGPKFEGGERTDPYGRLDLRLEKRWPLGHQGTISVVGEVLNATMSYEVTQRSCNAERCTEEGVGPLTIPSIGVEAKY